MPLSQIKSHSINPAVFLQEEKQIISILIGQQVDIDIGQQWWSSFVDFPQAESG